jgi:hypothetical protein
VQAAVNGGSELLIFVPSKAITRDFQISPVGPHAVHGLLIIVLHDLFRAKEGHRLWERIASNW